MKQVFFILSAIMLLLASCSKDTDSTTRNVPPTNSTNNPPPISKDYVQYLIRQGEQYSSSNNYASVSYSELKFKVKFDSSAIYQTVDPTNQKDINKLYGFSDNNAPHHQFSARFGWRWLNNALHIFAYIYNNGVLDVKEIGTVAIGAENDCSIKVAGDKYIFTLNGVTINMARASTTVTGDGYQLYPYFGGNEPAPHDIRIWIKQL